MRFQIKSSSLHLIPNNNHMLHLGTIGYGLREFIVMACIRGPKAGQCYIEEVVLNTTDFSNDVFANCKFIDDDNLANDLANFAEEKKLTDMKLRFEELKDQGKLKWMMPQNLQR